MACPSEFVCDSSHSRLFESFRASGGLPDCCTMEVAEDRLWLLFPESDFVVRTEPTRSPDDVNLVVTVSVRAPEPSLETWWDRWSISSARRDLATIALTEILACRNGVLRMLEERFDGLAPS